MMTTTNKKWDEAFKKAPQTLKEISKVKQVATAFNTCIDAVFKLNSKNFAKLIQQENISLKELTSSKKTQITGPKDVLRGAFKCFTKGIAEEWITEDINTYLWMQKHLKYKNLQMGGQAGIVANALALAGVNQVIAHCNSLPRLQSKLFLKQKNLVSFDEDGNQKQASSINRQKDIPLIHWIIEFNKDDSIIIEGKKFVCPKSNRFIATYDPLNLNLIIDNNFIKNISNKNLDLIFLSGYHALSSKNNGIKLIQDNKKTIKKIKNNALIHLEVASTQDIKIREEIIKSIAKSSDSIGLNERETIDVLEALNLNKLKQKCEENPNAINLFEGIIAIKKALKVKRVALHFFGMYITLLDKSLNICPKKTKDAMILASVVSSSKAGVGKLNKKRNLLWAKNLKPADYGLNELKSLSSHIKSKTLLSTGVCTYNGFYIIATPTILVNKPKTLVGMGDTISSISLVASL